MYHNLLYLTSVPTGMPAPLFPKSHHYYHKQTTCSPLLFFCQVLEQYIQPCLGFLLDVPVSLAELISPCAAWCGCGYTASGSRGSVCRACSGISSCCSLMHQRHALGCLGMKWAIIVTWDIGLLLVTFLPLESSHYFPIVGDGMEIWIFSYMAFLMQGWMAFSINGDD